MKERAKKTSGGSACASNSRYRFIIKIYSEGILACHEHRMPFHRNCFVFQACIGQQAFYLVKHSVCASVDKLSKAKKNKPTRRLTDTEIGGTRWPRSMPIVVLMTQLEKTVGISIATSHLALLFRFKSIS